MKFGQLLANYRENHNGGGISQAKLAELINVSQSTVAKYETHKLLPSLQTAKAITQVFQLNAEQSANLLLAAGYRSTQELITRNPEYAGLCYALCDTNMPDNTKQVMTKAILSIVEACSEIAREKGEHYQRGNKVVVEASRQCREALESSLRPIFGALVVNQAEALLRQNQIDKVSQLLSFAITQQVISDSQSANVLANMVVIEGDVLLEQGNWSKALEKYEEARAIFRNNGTDPTGQARAKRKQATIYLLRGDFPEAKTALEDALGTFDAHKDQPELAKTHFDLAWLYSVNGKLPEAKAHLQKGQTIANELNNSYLQMLAYSGFGYIYRQAQEWESARQNFLAARKLAQELKDEREEGWILLGLGRVEHLVGRTFWLKKKDEGGNVHFKDALTLLQDGLKILHKSKYRYRLNLARVLLGQLYLDDTRYGRCLPEDIDFFPDAPVNSTKLDRFAKIKKSYDYALSEFSSMGCNYYQAKVRQYICELLYIQMDPYAKGQEYSTESVDKKMEGEIKQIAKLDNAYKYPQYIAKAMADYGMVAVRQAQLQIAIKRFSNAFFCANNFPTSDILAEVEEKFDKAIEFIKNFRQLSAKELPSLTLEKPLNDSEAAKTFCLEMVKQIQNDSDTNLAHSSREKRERIDRLIQTCNEKIHDIKLERRTLTKAFPIKNQ